MKTQNQLLILFILALFLVFGSSCKVIRPQQHPRPSRTVIIHSNPNGKIPPGQMKKATGAKSAKHYAPGQAKKHKKNK